MSKNIVRYHSAAAPTLPSLDVIVNALLSRGWELRGDLLDRGAEFVQVMVCRDPEAAKAIEDPAFTQKVNTGFTQELFEKYGNVVNTDNVTFTDQWKKRVAVVMAPTDREMMAKVDEMKADGWKMSEAAYINDEGMHCHKMVKEIV